MATQYKLPDIIVKGRQEPSSKEKKNTEAKRVAYNEQVHGQGEAETITMKGSPNMRDPQKFADERAQIEANLRGRPVKVKLIVASSKSSGGSGGGGSTPGGSSGPGNPFFDSIIRAEGTAKYGDPYQTSLGYTPSPKPLTSMTMNEALQWGDYIRKHTKIGLKTDSSAKGAFQIVNKTQRAAMSALGIGGNELFSVENQRRMASWIARRQGLGAWEGFKFHPADRATAQNALNQGIDRQVGSGGGGSGGGGGGNEQPQKKNLRK